MKVCLTERKQALVVGRSFMAQHYYCMRRLTAIISGRFRGAHLSTAQVWILIADRPGTFYDELGPLKHETKNSHAKSRRGQTSLSRCRYKALDIALTDLCLIAEREQLQEYGHGVPCKACRVSNGNQNHISVDVLMVDMPAMWHCLSGFWLS